MSRLSFHHLTSLIVVLLCGFSSCTKIAKRTEGGAHLGSDNSDRTEAYGEQLGNSELVPLTQALSNAGQYAGRPITVQGHVRRACSAKGCWMELAADKEAGSPACRVTFKDYGFFVPTDSAGARATVEGEVAVKRVRASQVKHYEGEGASFPVKHEDGSADEVRFVATGVELRR